MRPRSLALSVLLSGGLALGLAAQQEPAKLLESAREAYLSRATIGKAKTAVELFAQAARADPKSCEARWEGARACYFYGNFTREDAPDSERMAIFQDGIDRARSAVALNPKGVEGHFWLGVLLGVYGEAKGIFKSLSLVPDIRAEMKTCLELDPSVEGYGPDRVLGRMLYKLPGWKGGDNKESIEHLLKSLQGAPTNALTRLYLAETYKSEGEKAKAIEQLKAVVDMKPDPRWAPEHPYIKPQAEALLRKLT
jgi:tetratricopeptide (TPR) repeat protein